MKSITILVFVIALVAATSIPGKDSSQSKSTPKNTSKKNSAPKSSKSKKAYAAAKKYTQKMSQAGVYSSEDTLEPVNEQDMPATADKLDESTPEEKYVNARLYLPSKTYKPKVPEYNPEDDVNPKEKYGETPNGGRTSGSSNGRKRSSKGREKLRSGGKRPDKRENYHDDRN
ncbi:hypothetical protein DSO57_1017298 [Entomophthora muscae]|uniref:Uncharacterized protein n=1 Tax=Entomophthora muscae TaxID=34485 RepID=A0ACC2RJC1_9FUNG|nr:hypothetical protein DSO57_1017298 [Entomophthora muscae]